LLLACSAAPARAQQLEPRAYSAAPVGLNFVGLANLHSSGDVVTDPSAAIQDVSAEVYTTAPYYARTFGLYGHQASVSLAMPYGWATVKGSVFEMQREVTRSGLLDSQLRLAMNLLGGPALTPREFRQRTPRTTLGASLVVNVPTGQYDPAKLVNLGTNRWAWKPELGLSQPVGKWIFELYAGVWLFQTNDNYFGGHVREQDPLAAYQTHIVYTFRPQMWAAADFTYYNGGQTTLNGLPQHDRQGSSRGGLTLALPLTSRQSLKLSWARGVSVRVGSSFETIGLGWQLAWL
jgi:hypothetical protein